LSSLAGLAVEVLQNSESVGEQRGRAPGVKEHHALSTLQVALCAQIEESSHSLARVDRIKQYALAFCSEANGLDDLSVEHSVAFGDIAVEDGYLPNIVPQLSCKFRKRARSNLSHELGDFLLGFRHSDTDNGYG
jgi:hypothetical protein